MTSACYEKMLEQRSARELDLGCHVSLKNRYIYFQVSKAASSSVKFALQSLEVAGTGRKVRSVNNRELSPHVWPSQLPIREFDRILRDPAFRKIAFVRNPFSRLLSCYLHRIVAEPNSASNRALARFTKGLAGPEISFGDFISAICDQNPREQESHWRIQSDEIFFSLIERWHFIGKVERLQEDIERCEEMIVGGRCGIKTYRSKDASPMKTSAQTKLREYYTPEILRMVVQKYRADFKNFGYSTSLDTGDLK